MDQASEAKFLASRKDFLTLDSTSLNRNQEIKFGNGRGNELASVFLSRFFPCFPIIFLLFTPI